MFFKKKPQYLNLKHSQLAKAIECESKLDFNQKNKFYTDKKYGFIYDVISIDEHIDITINYLHRIYSDANCICMETYMYIDGVKVNQYEFRKELRENYASTNIWVLENKKIFHKIPNEVIQKINDWSYNVVTKQKEKETVIKNKKKNEQETKHHLEELKLKEIYKNYKGGNKE